MPKETLDAVYENGVFRPLKSPDWIDEHRRVTLTVSIEDGHTSIADCVGRLAPEDAREMREIIEREFETVDPHEWR